MMRPPCVIRPNRLDAIVHYNSKMGAINKQDAMTEPYNATRKTSWWHKKLIHLLQIPPVNAFFLYQKYGGKLDFLQYHGYICNLGSAHYRYCKTRKSPGTK